MEPQAQPTRYLDRDGHALVALPAFARDPETLVAFYRAMLRTRTFDAKAVALQRTGRLGTYASSLGEEAVGVGLASAMRPEDVLLPSFREHAAQLWRGVTLDELLLYWGGDERGNDFAGPRRDFPNAIPIASQVPQAAGVALAMKLRGEDRAAVCVMGDGATSKGDFYEGLNAAGVWALPAVFVIANNGWAISLPRQLQTAAATLAQKAVAAGIEGIQVDGNDVIAMHAATAQALAKARRGEGPTLIEALTYRLGDHTTVDDARRYRPQAEVDEHRRDEPLVRLKRCLVAAGAWDEARDRALADVLKSEVETAVEAYLARAPEPAAAMFDYLFDALPPALAAQRDEVDRG